MLSKTDFQQLWANEIPHELTNGQKNACEELTNFLYLRGKGHLFILKGYAGTGKTTLISALVKTFKKLHKNTLLLAPTGRAAKVFSTYSSQKAFTIHKIIYKIKNNGEVLEVMRKPNKLQRTLFIVDEVSMIADMPTSDKMFGARSLLSDFLAFVFEGEGNKVIFVGDDAQIPPVHLDESPALSIDYLNVNFDVQVNEYQLTEVVRQTLHSGILSNATALREKIHNQDEILPYFLAEHFNDFTRIDGTQLEEVLNDLYGMYEPDEIVTITRSNKRANLFNQEVRNRIFFKDDKIAAGDLMMAVKNNYYWVDESSPMGFIANGDMLEVVSIQKTIDRYGFSFADVNVRMCDYPNESDISLKIIVDSIDVEEAALNSEQNKKLYREISEDYADITSKKERYQAIKNDPFLNALQVKFAYSLTCHKTQGGEWKAVILDLNYFTEEHQNIEFLRWLYTAVTRAKTTLYLLNFPDDFFEN